MTWWKVLDGVEPVHGGSGRYPGEGRWTRRIPDVEACERGYHLAKDAQLLSWLPRLDSFTVWEATPGDVLVDAGNKWVTDRVRLDRRFDADASMLRLFAADCAEAALLGERACGREPDERSWAAVAVARRYAVGDATADERAAAGAAAWDAARDAAADAADAAGAAARAAAWDAADAAGDAAWAAAGAAAWAAAWDAADAAGDAAGDAAWAAAGVTAGAAARDAAWDRLYGMFVARLHGEPVTVTALHGAPK